jgi:hypothetical protein
MLCAASLAVCAMHHGLRANGMPCRPIPRTCPVIHSPGMGVLGRSQFSANRSGVCSIPYDSPATEFK